MRVDSQLPHAYAVPLDSVNMHRGEVNVRKGINPTQALILGSLHSGDLSGSQISAIATDMGGWWNHTRSQIYREMPGLEERGYIKIITDKVPAAYKELYRITAAGKKAYKDWRAVTTPPDLIRNPWVLRYALSQYDGTGSADIALAAADYYRKAKARLEIDEEHLGSDALGKYYALMESWFADLAR